MNKALPAMFFGLSCIGWPQTNIRVDVDIVRVPCVVRDRTGAPVQGLGRDEFAVLEDGVPQRIEYLWRESDLPLRIGLVVDVSGSQMSFISEHRSTIMEFLSHVLSPGDSAFLLEVADQQRLVTDWTESLDRLRRGVESLGQMGGEILGAPCAGIRYKWRSCLGTVLWNGVYYSATLKMGPTPGRKALLLLTDGIDTGSDHSLAEAIEASQRADVTVYSVRYFDRFVAHWTQSRPARRKLERLSSMTGGVAFNGHLDSLSTIFEHIETDLRTQYVLGYRSAPASRVPRYRRIQVKVRRPGLTVRARKGYFTITHEPLPRQHGASKQ